MQTVQKPTNYSKSSNTCCTYGSKTSLMQMLIITNGSKLEAFLLHRLIGSYESYVGHTVILDCNITGHANCLQVHAYSKLEQAPLVFTNMGQWRSGLLSQIEPPDIGFSIWSRCLFELGHMSDALPKSNNALQPWRG